MFLLRTLGSVSLMADGQPLVGRSTQRRRLALLALLALARGRGLTRDKLLGLLWPERDTDTARHTLSQTLYAVRRELGEDALVVGVDDVRLNPAVVTSDVGEFEDALAAGQRERAVELYVGAFLDGFYIADAPEFERWTDGERRRLADAYGAALVALAEDAARQRDHARAITWWRKRAALDPLNAHVAARLMTALAEGGDRAGAIQHARVHAELLRQELQVGPDPEVSALAERLRGLPPAVATTSVVVPTPALAPAQVPERPSSPSRRWTPRRWALAAGSAALGLVVVGAVISSGRARVPARMATRPVVLGTIVSPDASLGLAVREALRADLEADGRMRVLGESPIRETLVLMRLPPDTQVRAGLAVEIAQRRGVTLVVVGSATPLGTGAQLVGQLLDARTGEPIATASERPGSAAEVVPAVARLAAALRAYAIGAPVVAAAQPLPAVTTASLPALRNYARAREALHRLDRPAAIALLEAAIAHDSLFALAHYLVGDVLWYVDQYGHSVTHFTTALRLSDRLPPRERLIVRARYEQLVQDRLDSALAYWQQVRASYPDEPLAYEGLVWNYIALERHADMAAIAETALQLMPNSPDMVRFRYSGLIAIGDTAAALAFAHSVRQPFPRAEFLARTAMLERYGAWEEALRQVDSAYPPQANGAPNVGAAQTRQPLLLAMGRLDEAWREMETIVQEQHMQNPPRALLFQAHAEIGWRAPSERARGLVRQAVAWIDAADIYPPAVARLTELAVTAAARLRDTTIIAAARRLVLARDGGRGLPSLTTALLTIDAADAFARGDMRRAATLAARSRPTKFHGRPRQPITLLEAGARDAFGDRAGADALYRELSSSGSFWQTLAQRALARHGAL